MMHARSNSAFNDNFLALHRPFDLMPAPARMHDIEQPLEALFDHTCIIRWRLYSQ